MTTPVESGKVGLHSASFQTLESQGILAMKIYKYIVAILFCVSTVLASGAKINVTPETIVGLWEAVSPETLRVFQMEIGTNGQGVFTEAYAYQSIFEVYALTKKTVEKDGKFLLEFTSEDGGRIHIRGTGSTTREQGVLWVQLERYPVGILSGEKIVWDGIKFFKFAEGQTYVEVLAELSKCAEKLRKGEPTEGVQYKKKRR